MISKSAKLVFVLLLVSVVLISGCTEQSVANGSSPSDSVNSNQLTECPQGQVKTDSGCMPENKEETPNTIPDESSKPANNEPTEQSQTIKEFSMTAKQWSFDPETITVKKGDHVKLTIKSIDVTHGFAIPDFGVSENLEPNKEIVVEFDADKTGTFTFFCSVFCGSGHASMKGTLVVEE